MLQRGSRVIIHKPSDVDESPTWIPEMDRYDGMECIVYVVEPRITLTVVYVYEPNFEADGITSGFAFNINWCEEVLIPEEEIEVDDTVWNSYLEEWKQQEV